MEFEILYALQGIRTELLDKIVLFLTNFNGSNGEIWLALGAILLIFKKTRKMGFAVLLSYGLTWVICQDVIKDIVCRARPCHIDESVELLIKRPTSYSCPSTHSALAMAMATSVFSYNKKFGIGAIIVALTVGFCRMYLFVHFPSDVLLGFIVGTISAIICVKLINYIYQKIDERLTKNS